jgi:hypothetical protein
MIQKYNAKPSENMTCKDKSSFSSVELNTRLMLMSPSFHLVESKFRATDRNLTIRLRNHENKRP